MPASGAVMVTVTAGIMSSGNGEEGFMGFALSGANTVAASDTRVVRGLGRNANDTFQGSATYYVSGLTAGNTTFTAKYRTETGGTVNNTFSNRTIIVTPLP